MYLWFLLLLQNNNEQRDKGISQVVSYTQSSKSTILSSSSAQRDDQEYDIFLFIMSAIYIL